MVTAPDRYPSTGQRGESESALGPGSGSALSRGCSPHRGGGPGHPVVRCRSAPCAERKGEAALEHDKWRGGGSLKTSLHGKAAAKGQSLWDGRLKWIPGSRQLNAPRQSLDKNLAWLDICCVPLLLTTRERRSGHGPKVKGEKWGGGGAGLRGGDGGVGMKADHQAAADGR